MRLVYLLLCAVLPLSCFSAEPVFHHSMKIRLDPEAHQIQVTDQIHGVSAGTLRFRLHEGLAPISKTSGVSLHKVSGPTQEEPLADVFEMTVPTSVHSVELSYQGMIFHPLAEPGTEYERSFGETPGIISAEGIYLARSSLFYPEFETGMVTFSLDVTLPKGWDAVSQGNRMAHERNASGTRVTWEAADRQDDIYLIGAQFTEYQQAASANGNAVDVYAFLRTPDPQLAAQYMDATGRYIQMYNELIGAYPYGKFALVENFWETGYGMPSFTLLGPKIIRFPFIINSSYPHEILHNWWGNSVYVDYFTGNWCEGLTAYLADHLMKEQQGAGVEYRRTTLQKFTDYVTAENDFPLSHFRERSNAASEAIGYGKSSMLDHMLRQKLGDRIFLEGIRRFYRDGKFNVSGFADLRKAMEAVSGLDLRAFFTQWVAKTGAPELAVVSAVAFEKAGGSFELRATLAQRQPGEAFQVDVPLAIHLEGKPAAFQTRVSLQGQTTEVVLDLPARPFLFEVDPEFDVFRRLDRYEISPSLSQGLGAKKTLVILPSNASPEEYAEYLSMARTWQRDATQDGSGEFEILSDSEVGALPSDRAVWVLGWSSRFASLIETGLKGYDLAFDADSIRVGNARFSRANHALVVSLRNPGNPAHVLSWVAADPAAAIEGLGAKLPHYGKYSYLVFEGAEPTNVSKGIWPAVGSPMSVPVVQADGSVLTGTRARLFPRSALIGIPEAFSSARMRESVKVLADPSMKGRDTGSPELDAAADFISGMFRRAGLQPGGDSGFFQDWTLNLPAPRGETKMRNVVGFIPGRNAAFSGQSIVIAAHYDHLGMNEKGEIFSGADDNASGVAVLLELARYYGEKAQDGVLPERALIFAALTGEEIGLLGSKHYVEGGAAGGAYPATRAFAMLNLDTVGRLFGKKLMVMGAGSAREWPQIVAGVGYVTGIGVLPVTNDIAGSDHYRFIQAGVPALHFFSGANEDYHRPSDTAEKLDWDGMVKVARVVQETADYLTSRKDALNLENGPCGDCEGGGTRKVYLGTVPDFSFAGPGVRVEAVQAGSPAEKAGLLAGDIIVSMNGQLTSTLKAFSDFLKTLKGGDAVAIHVQRANNELDVVATVIEH